MQPISTLKTEQRRLEVEAAQASKSPEGKQIVALISWLHEEAKERAINCHRDDREMHVGHARAYSRLEKLLKEGPAVIPTFTKKAE